MRAQETRKTELKRRFYGINGASGIYSRLTIELRASGKICKTQKTVLTEDKKVIKLLHTLQGSRERENR